MCSIPDDDTEVNFLVNESELSISESSKCKKCGTNKAGVVLRKKDPYCDSCFVERVTHKFRASLGKSKIVRHGDRVLIGYSGDSSTCTLLNLIETGLREDTHKKLKFEPIVLYIDEGTIFNETLDERIKRRNDVYELIIKNNLPFKLFMTSISNLFQQEIIVSDDVNLLSDEKSDNRVKQLMTSVKNLTTKQDLYKKMRQTLLLKCAKELDCKFIFLAETATKLASTLLCNVSLGAGSHLSSDVVFCDSRNEIKILRPLKDFTSEELTHFILLKNISYIDHKSFITENNPYASIQSLTDKFVKDLQKDFPATISTILKTGEKLENKSNEQSMSEDICAICQSELDTQLVNCSSLEATTYSKLISNIQDNEGMKTNVEAQEPDECQNVSGCGECRCRGSSSLSKKDIEKFLCYSCRLILKEVKDTNDLPLEFLSSIRFKKSLNETRNEIKDFLL